MRDTSSKIKAVKLSTFKSGKYVGCYAPSVIKVTQTSTFLRSIR